MQEPHAFLTDGHTVADIAVFVLVVVVLPVRSIVNGRRIGTHAIVSLASRYVWLIARGAAIATLVLAIWLADGRPFSALGLDLPVGDAGRVGLIFVGLLAVVGAAVTARSIRKAMPERIRRLRDQATEVRILPRTNVEMGLFVGVAAMAGLVEELLYRGFMIWFLAPSAGMIGAVLVSTVAFAIGHLYQGWRGVLRTGGVGLAFAIWYVVTGSLWWLMALHALIDLFGGLFAWRLLRPASAGTEALARG